MKKTTAGLLIASITVTGLGVGMVVLAPSEETARQSTKVDQSLIEHASHHGHSHVELSATGQGEGPVKPLPKAIQRVRELATYDDQQLWDLALAGEVIADRGAAIDLLWERGQAENLTSKAAAEGDAFMRAKVKALSEMRG